LITVFDFYNSIACCFGYEEIGIDWILLDFYHLSFVASIADIVAAALCFLRILELYFIGYDCKFL
jgi:hypothetical protein